MTLIDTPTLIDEALRRRLVERVAKDHPDVDPVAAVAEALEFLATSVPGDVPDSLADAGWHTFLLFTRDYAEFCDRVRGYFVHHDPIDDDRDGPCKSDCGSCRCDGGG